MAVRSFALFCIFSTVVDKISGEAGRDNPAILSFLRDSQESYHLDLIFIVDSSSFVTQSDFYDVERNIVRQIVQHFLYVSPERTHLAILTYSDIPRTVVDNISGTGPSIKCDFVNNATIWQRMLYEPGGTSTANLQLAFQQAKTIMSNGASKRRFLNPLLKQIALLITSGKFKDSTEESSAKAAGLSLQTSGVMMHAIVLDSGSYNTVKDIVIIKDYISYARDWSAAFSNQHNNIGSIYTVGKQYDTVYTPSYL